ncbi:flagellar assembly protein FliW [Rhodoferax sp. 4810]|uniref:Flagellar assembly factor FliW n=1 Tax=Thiospirillum jenense TaxID=1653858 RepID=A0A839HCZ2_9GAMM|nr:flagellar assembly protein FliW [Thiospirillum jenense]MBB1074202.1 flagellar assembly protein FliW [Rhodoferax jenense]MBB1125276.1 flagellar assembly protein FliW [Thiospirillum jenense]
MTTDTAHVPHEADKIISFPEGIPGFEEYKQYVLFHSEEQDSNLYWLESVEAPEIQFTLVDPTVYGVNYTLDLTDEEEALLQSEDPNEIQVFLMLSKKRAPDADSASINANIAGPILINVRTRLGMQKILVRSHVEVHIIQD